MRTSLARLTQGMFIVSCAALVVMLLSYLTEVVSRYVFDAPTSWSSDVVSYAMLLCVALALPAVTRDQGHVAITSLVERLTAPRRRQAHSVLSWVSGLACAAATALLASQALSQWQGGIDTVAALAIPKWWLSGVAALGFAGAGANFLVHGVHAHTDVPDAGSAT